MFSKYNYVSFDTPIHSRNHHYNGDSIFITISLPKSSFLSKVDFTHCLGTRQPQVYFLSLLDYLHFLNFVQKYKNTECTVSFNQHNFEIHLCC